jgi:citrate synthase
LDAVVERLAGSISANRSAEPARAFAAVILALDDIDGDVEDRHAVAIRTAQRLIFALAGCFGLLSHAGRYAAPGETDKTIATYLLNCMDVVPDPDAIAAINAVLVLSADHELASATFSARVAASLGADLHGCVLSALACNIPPPNVDEWPGGAQRKAEFTADRLNGAFSARVTAINMPVFNHPLYPKGDPRGTHLITIARKLQKRRRGGRRELKLLDQAGTSLGFHPTLLAGIFAVCVSLGLPERTAMGLFLLGRTAGWIAHVIEQRLAGFVVRPRARFQLARDA